MATTFHRLKLTHFYAGDPRIRGFPFPTRRPTQAELVRCFTELTRVKLSHLTAAELDELDEVYRQSMMPKPAPLPKPDQPKVPQAPRLSKEELLERDRWERVVDMARRGRLDALRGFIEKQSAEGSASQDWSGLLPDWMEEQRTSPTLLHIAASSDQPEVVRWLLEDRRADPTLASSSPPMRTAYECSASRAVRNIFRRLYADHPDWWEWQTAARVPSQLTEGMEAQQADSKKTAHKVGLKQKMKERAAEREAERVMEAEKQRLAEEAEQTRKAAERAAAPNIGAQRLGGAAPRAVMEQTQLKGLSEQAKMRIERERRAKAAEARMAAN